MVGETVTVRIPPVAAAEKAAHVRSIVEAGNPPGIPLNVANQGSHRTRSLVWEEDAPAEPRARRTQQSVPVHPRGLPFEMDDLDDSPGGRKGRFGGARAPWWKPAGSWGRAILVAGLLVVAGAFAYTIHLCTSFFEHDARFRVAGTSNIQAVGLAEVTRADILPVFGEDVGRNIFFVPIGERRKQLEQIPWIQQATVMRLLPDQIRVSIVERQPVAFVRHGQQIGLVDANGVLLNMPAGLMTQHHYSFPVLTGIDGGDPLSSRKMRVELYTRLMSDLDAGGKHFSDQISEIDLTDPEDARVLMPEQGSDVLAHFGQDHFLDRYQRYKAHITEWRQQYPKLAAVDLRYEQQVVLQMAHGAEDTKAVNPASGAVAETAATAAKPTAAKPTAAKPTAAKPTAAKPTAAKLLNPPQAKTVEAMPKVVAKVDASRAAVKSPSVVSGKAGTKTAVAHPVAGHSTTAKNQERAKAQEKASLKNSAKTFKAAKAAAAKKKAKKHPLAKKPAHKTKQKTSTAPHASAAAKGQ